MKLAFSLSYYGLDGLREVIDHDASDTLSTRRIACILSEPHPRGETIPAR